MSTCRSRPTSGPAPLTRRALEIGLYERGVHDVRQAYDSEQAAAAGLYAALTGRPAPY